MKKKSPRIPKELGDPILMVGIGKGANLVVMSNPNQMENPYNAGALLASVGMIVLEQLRLSCDPVGDPDQLQEAVEAMIQGFTEDMASAMEDREKIADAVERAFEEYQDGTRDRV